jgi:hypothetical protein
VISTKAVKPTLQFAYVKLMMDVVGRGLVMASQVDDEIQRKSLNFLFFYLSMNVFPNGPAFIASDRRKTIRAFKKRQKARFNNYFKHLTHAFGFFFQESTAQAFA